MTTQEQREQAEDMAHLERGGANPTRSAVVKKARTNVTSPGYVRINEPKSGEPRTFVPGETLPGWVAEALADDARVTLDEDTNVWTVADHAPEPKKNAAGRRIL